MRVLLIETVAVLGGAQWSLFELAGQLKNTGVSVLVAAPKGPLYNALLEADIPVQAIPCYRARRNPWYFLRAINRLCASAALRKAARVFAPDVIHANSITAGRIALPLAETYPFVCHVRDLRFSGRGVLRIAQQTNRMVANSESVDAALAEFLRGSPRSRLTCVVNGIDLERFVPRDTQQARQICNIPSGVPLVTMIAHFVPWKRHDLFIAMAGLIAQARPDVHFAIVGSTLLGENTRYRATLHAHAARLGLEKNMHWFGEISDVRDVLQASDLLVHPTPDEPFGRVLCEAMAMAKPVVAIRAHGPMSIVETDATGILADNTDPAQLATAVLRLLDNPREAAAFGAAGRKRVAALFSIKRTADDMHKVYQAAIDDFRPTQAVP